MFWNRKKNTLKKLGIDFNDWRLASIKDTLRYGDYNDAHNSLQRLHPNLSQQDVDTALKAIADELGIIVSAPPPAVSSPSTVETTSHKTPDAEVSSTAAGGIDLNAPEFEAVRQAMQAGRKIEAIKELRRITGWGLKEAKDTVDAYMSSGSPPIASRPTGSVWTTNNFDPHDPVFNEVWDWLRQQKKINAVKEMRRITGWGLKEAKDAVDQMERSLS